MTVGCQNVTEEFCYHLWRKQETRNNTTNCDSRSNMDTDTGKKNIFGSIFGSSTSRKGGKTSTSITRDAADPLEKVAARVSSEAWDSNEPSLAATAVTDSSTIVSDARRPNDNFNEERKLYDLINNYSNWNGAIAFLNNDRITPQNKTAAVNYKDGINRTTLMLAAYYGAPLTLIQQLCEIGGKPLIMATNDYGGWTALHGACNYRDDTNIDNVKYLVQNGGMELVNKKNEDGETALDLIRSDPTNDAVRNFLKNFQGE